MKLDLSSDLDRKRFEERCKYLLDKQKRVELKEIREKRSLSHNAYLHLILAYYGLEVGYTLHEAKVLFKRLSLDIFVYTKNGTKFLRSSADLDDRELSLAIEKFRFTCATNGIYIPQPEDKAQLNEIEYQIGRYDNQKYL